MFFLATLARGLLGLTLAACLTRIALDDIEAGKGGKGKNTKGKTRKITLCYDGETITVVTNV